MIEWTDVPPKVVGWYATKHSWDASEGSFPDAHYWNGEGWALHESRGAKGTTSPIFVWSSAPFETEKQAEDWAYEHDDECQ